MYRDVGRDAVGPQARRAMEGRCNRTADNAFDVCNACRRCDRRYTASNRGPHADPPRVFSVFLRHPAKAGAHFTSRSAIPLGPHLVPAIRMGGGNGRDPPRVLRPVVVLRLDLCRAVRITGTSRRRLRGYHRKARANAANSLICKGFDRSWGCAMRDLWINCLRRATNPGAIWRL